MSKMKIKVRESKKNERGTTKIETYVGFDELLGYADAEYLLEDVVDVLSKYYTYEDETFDEDQAKNDPEFTIKIEGGDERADFYSEDIFYVHLPNKEAAEELAKVLGGELSESKKPESKMSEDVSDDLKGIDVKEGSILEDVVDWAEYEVGEGYTVKELLEELMNKGVYSGMTFLISYEDGKKFFEEHKQEINEILAEAMSDLGQFPELQDFEKDDPLCLGQQNQFCLSAFAFEKVASELLDMILDKEQD